MTRRFIIIVMAGLIALLSVLSCQEKGISEDEPMTLVYDLEEKIAWLDYRIALEQWQLYTTGQADSLVFFEGLFNHLISDNEQYSALARAKGLIKDDLDSRRRDFLEQTMLMGKIESSASIVAIRDSLSNIDINYRAEFEGEKRSESELYKLYRTDPDDQRRESAYRAWVAVGDEMADGVSRLFRVRNQQTRKFGYNNYFGMALAQRGIKLADYTKLLTQLDSLSIGPYTQIVEEIKGELNKDYIDVWDLAYASASVTNEIDAYFPADTQLVMVRKCLEDIGFDIDKMPIYYDLEPREGKSQLAYAFPIKPPYDMRILGNVVDGLYSTTVLMHEIGHAIHSAHLSQEIEAFNRNIDGIWIESIGQLFAALVKENDFLSTYGGVPADLISRYGKAKKRQDIIYLRTTLLRLQFEYQAFLNPNRDLNQLYWDLSEEYMQLPRHDDLKPWAALIYYTTHPTYMLNYLYADIVTAQTLNFIKKNYTSYMGNMSSGSFLTQNYMRFGSRYDWRDLLKRGTDADLDPKFFIEQLTL